jgi:hypothetical protein
VLLDSAVLQSSQRRVTCERRPKGNDKNEAKVSARTFQPEDTGTAKATRPKHNWWEVIAAARQGGRTYHTGCGGTRRALAFTLEEMGR